MPAVYGTRQANGRANCKQSNVSPQRVIRDPSREESAGWVFAVKCTAGEGGLPRPGKKSGLQLGLEDLERCSGARRGKGVRRVQGKIPEPIWNRRFGRGFGYSGEASKGA